MPGTIEARVEELLSLPGEDEFGKVRPSQAAVAAVKELVQDLVSTYDQRVPDPDDIGVDHDGAIRIEWRCEGRFLEYIVPQDPQNDPPLVYMSDPDGWNGVRAETDVIWDSLNWLQGQPSSLDEAVEMTTEKMAELVEAAFKPTTEVEPEHEEIFLK